MKRQRKPVKNLRGNTARPKGLRRLKIGIDLDGVLLDHAEAKMAAGKKLGYAFSRRMTHRDTLKRLMESVDYEKMQRVVYGKRSLRSSPVRGALAGMRYLMRRADVHIISRRKTSPTALAWITKHLPEFPRKNIFFVKRDADKDVVARRLGIDVHLDDLANVLRVLPSVRHRFLLDEHNAYRHPPRGAVKIRSWREFLKEIKCIFERD